PLLTTSEREKTTCETRWPIPGTTRLKSRQHNTYETKLLILTALPGATTTSRRMVRIMNEMFNSSPLWDREL
ncbi:MAG: hypothetical protein LC740_17235, partial [Actinobacteria bacterium]|nr:hypothetical protein [Actinomycetota bacterium]